MNASFQFIKIHALIHISSYFCNANIPHVSQYSTEIECTDFRCGFHNVHTNLEGTNEPKVHESLHFIFRLGLIRFMEDFKSSKTPLQPPNPDFNSRRKVIIFPNDFFRSNFLRSSLVVRFDLATHYKVQQDLNSTRTT